MSEQRGYVACHGCGGHWSFPQPDNSLMRDERAARAWLREHRGVCRGPAEVVLLAAALSTPETPGAPESEGGR